MSIKKNDKIVKESKNQKPVWLKLSEKDLKKLIAELAKEHEQPAKIGLILRDQYGVPSTRVYGKKLVEYLEELGFKDRNNMEFKNAEKKVERMRKHLDKNVTDRRSKHKFQKAQSRVNVLKRKLVKKSV